MRLDLVAPCRNWSFYLTQLKPCQAFFQKSYPLFHNWLFFRNRSFLQQENRGNHENIQSILEKCRSIFRILLYRVLRHKLFSPYCELDFNGHCRNLTFAGAMH